MSSALHGGLWGMFYFFSFFLFLLDWAVDCECWYMEWLQRWSETQRTLLATGEKRRPLWSMCVRTKSVKKKKTKKTMSNTSRCWSVQQGRVIVTLLSLSLSILLSVSGVCECSDFTTGMTCEHCLDGYYGNALIGTPGDCQPCPCPDRTSCSQIAETGQVVCTNCPAGRTGEMTTSDAASFLFLSFSFFSMAPHSKITGFM